MRVATRQSRGTEPGRTSPAGRGDFDLVPLIVPSVWDSDPLCGRDLRLLENLVTDSPLERQAPDKGCPAPGQGEADVEPARNTLWGATLVRGSGRRGGLAQIRLRTYCVGGVVRR
jgi:hypothetical protein